MVKKILIICGSPRPHGNTMTVAHWVAEGARHSGADVDIVDATELKARAAGCIACMGCQKSTEYKCVLKDDVADLVGRIPDYNIVVLATPVYFMGVSAQLKIVLDRMYSLIKFNPVEERFHHPLKNTTFALIATAGGDENSGLDLVRQMIRKVMEMLGVPFKALTVPNAPFAVNEIQNQSDLRNKAYTFGGDLLQQRDAP